MMDDMELRLEQIPDRATNSTLSDFENSDNSGQIKSEATEHDRFIPHRQLNLDQARNFENKEFLFASKQFNCTHSVNERCDCAKLEQISIE